MATTADADLVPLVRALGADGRLRLLRALHSGDATVSDLADRLALDQPRVSTHLAALREVGLVTAHAVGRQRVYHVDAKRVGGLLDALAALGPEPARRAEPTPISAQAARLVGQDAPLRQARSCYDHLAGVAGVQLLEELLERNWLVAHEQARRVDFRLSAAGEVALAARQVDLGAARRARRQYAFACLDWTERRPHLGGALGAAILAALRSAGIARAPSGVDPVRSLRLAEPLDRWLDSA
jgi:DNA-binding transcriptional ArsR family regulator